MPTKTSSLSIKALPLEVVPNNYQILSPSAFLPTTALFTLQITTINDPSLKRTYKINVKQSNHLMQKSSLFYSLSTRYTRLALNFEESLEQSLIEEAGGLPMIFIEAPVNGLGGMTIVDAFLNWLYTTDDALTSSLASKIQSHQDFFSLLNLSTLLDLFEPYRTAVDEILVYYYFGLSTEERRNGILNNDQFVEGLVPGKFVRRLVESVNESEAKEILASFFRGKPLDEINRQHEIKNDEEWEELLYNDTNSLDYEYESNILDWISRHEACSTPSTPLTEPLDYAEPPTPMGSAYFYINSPPLSKSKIHVLSRSLPQTPKSVGLKQFSYFRVPPNTPKTPNTLNTPSTPNTPKVPQAPPNTPNTPKVPQAPPNTPILLTSNSSNILPRSPPPTTIVNDFELSSVNYFSKRRELFNNVLNKIRKITIIDN
ncbi:hypothetical protein Glove_99g336 [Diversispora epigaea]|uniref:Uncharacterized protein n=1 Tax=Diversispora epigaea TaxID=1348612 RepID=A0A397J8S8_9GLOM|nr:hypothetical protein Glove_99g336 [Diversispora epigaea]